MNTKAAAGIYTMLVNMYGIPEPDLVFSNIYELTIAVLLSAQTTDRQVNRVTPLLFRQYPSFEHLANASAEHIQPIIRSTGFYRNKSRNMINLASAIVNDLDGTFPETLDEMIRLPGIGRKSANVILSQGLNRPGLAVDTHVARISRRLELASGNNVDKIEEQLKRIFPEDRWGNLHLLLIHHGRKRCFARGPLCADCPLTCRCSFPKDTP